MKISVVAYLLANIQQSLRSKETAFVQSGCFFVQKLDFSEVVRNIQHCSVSKVNI